MPAGDDIITVSTNQGVVPTFSNERIIAIAPAEDVTAFAALDNVVPDVTINIITATRALKKVITRTPAQIISTANTEQGNRMRTSCFNTIPIT